MDITSFEYTLSLSLDDRWDVPTFGKRVCGFSLKFVMNVLSASETILFRFLPFARLMSLFKFYLFFGCLVPL